MNVCLYVRPHKRTEERSSRVEMGWTWRYDIQCNWTNAKLQTISTKEYVKSQAKYSDILGSHCGYLISIFTAYSVYEFVFCIICCQLSVVYIVKTEVNTSVLTINAECV